MNNKKAKWSLGDFKKGKVRIDFTKHTHKEILTLRILCELINPGRDTPAYTFGACYYCKDGRWYEGATHNFIGFNTCRAEEINMLNP